MIPKAPSNLDPDLMKPRALSGGKYDSERSRIIKGFYSYLPEDKIVAQDITKEILYLPTLNQRFQIFSYLVPSDRTFFVDSVVFFATQPFGGGLVPTGVVEGALQCYFEVGRVVPAGILTARVQSGQILEDKAYFPFLNESIGQTKTTFTLKAKSGRELNAYYINMVTSPLPIYTVGVRVRGWMIDSNVIEEILAQQQ
jgi:hypothetical protein